MGLIQAANDHPVGPTSMRTQLAASPDDIDLIALGVAIRRALLKLLLAALAVGLASFVALSLLTPKYQSQAQIEIVSKVIENYATQVDRAAEIARGRTE